MYSVSDYECKPLQTQEQHRGPKTEHPLLTLMKSTFIIVLDSGFGPRVLCNLREFFCCCFICFILVLFVSRWIEFVSSVLISLLVQYES